jgi:hypothetical protein
MGLDLNFDYNKLKEKISATQAYNELKDEYLNVIKKAGDTQEEDKTKSSDRLSEVIKKNKKYQKDLKNQFDRLLDVGSVTKGGGSGSVSFIKKLLLKTIKNIEPKLADILFEEAINAIGCDQQQTYLPGQVVYLKVSSVDLLGLLKKEPESVDGKLLYENNPVVIQDFPFSMNKELYNRTQAPNVSYSSSNGSPYKGSSGQNLFDIEYTEVDNSNQTGPWFKVTFSQRANNATTISQFLIDYYKSIKLVEFETIMANIMNGLTGALSIKGNIGTKQAEIDTKFGIIIKRILGICFDTDNGNNEINVSGVAKVPVDDPIDDSFFEFTDIDLRNIDLTISNLKNGVVQYENCGDVLLPVDVDSIISALDSLRFVPDNDKVNAASQLTQSLINNPAWNVDIPNGNINVAVDTNFLKLLAQGVTFSLLSPKVLLPIFAMLVSLGQQALALIENLVDFAKNFKKFVVNLISKISALFVQELFETIRRDLLQLVQRALQDINNERVRKITAIILKLIQILFVVAQLITDWRKCKSIIDELIQIMSVGGQIAQDILGALTSQVPLPLLFASEFLGGYSESRAFIGTIEELQRLGIPTGPLPDGTPNLTVLAMYSQLKAAEKEKTENGKVQVAIKPTTITPAGVTVPLSASGLYF